MKLIEKWISLYQENRITRNKLPEEISNKNLIYLMLFAPGLIFLWLTYYLLKSEYINDVSILSITLISSFIILYTLFRILIEKQLKMKLEEKYSTFMIIHIDVIKVISVILITHLIFFVNFLNMIIPDIVIILLSILSVLSYLYVVIFESRAEVHKKSFFHIIITAIILSFIYRIVFYLSDTRNILDAYMISTITVFVVYILKSLWIDQSIQFLKYNLYLSGFLFAIFFPYYYTFDESILNDEGDFIISNMNYIPMELNNEHVDIFGHQGNLYVQKENDLYVYDENYLWIETFTPNLEDVSFYMFKENTLRAYIQTEPYYFDEYLITSGDETYIENIYFVDHILKNTVAINDVNLTITVDRLTHLLQFYTLDGEEYTFQDEQTNYVLEQTNDYLIIRENTYYYIHSSNVNEDSNLISASYSNNKLIYEDLGYYYSVDVEDYLNGQDGKQLPFYGSRIISFYYENNRYNFVVRNFETHLPSYELIVVDKWMRIESRTEVSKDTKLYENYFVTYVQGNALRFIDPDEPILYFVSEDAEFLDNMQLIFLFVILFSLPVRIPTLISGKKE